MNKNETVIILAIVAFFALLVTYMYVDEFQDGVGERACMEQVGEIKTEQGWSPDCDL